MVSFEHTSETHPISFEWKNFYFRIVASDQNDIHDEILNLEEKNDQDIVDEIKENTCHNPVPKDQKQNAKL